MHARNAVCITWMVCPHQFVVSERYRCAFTHMAWASVALESL